MHFQMSLELQEISEVTKKCLIYKNAIIQQPKQVCKSKLVKRTLDQSVIHFWDPRSRKGQPEGILSGNMQVSSLICKTAIIQQPEHVCKSKVKRTLDPATRWKPHGVE